MKFIIRQIFRQYWATYGKAPVSLNDLLSQVEEGKRGAMLDAIAPGLLEKRAQYDALFDQLREQLPPAAHWQETLREYEETARHVIREAEHAAFQAILGEWLRTEMGFVPILQ